MHLNPSFFTYYTAAYEQVQCRKENVSSGRELNSKGEQRHNKHDVTS